MQIEVKLIIETHYYRDYFESMTFLYISVTAMSLLCVPGTIKVL